jgi:hypothetical protein
MGRLTARSNFAGFGFALALAASSLLCARLAADELRTALDTRTTPTMRQEVWQAVAAELRARGLSEPQLPLIEDLDLPPALPAVAGRKLRVSSACWDAVPERTQFRLECAEPGECLPFLVYLRDAHVHSDNAHDDDAQGERANEGNRDTAAWAASCRLESRSRPVLGAPPQPLRKPTVRAGDRATAVFASDRVRIAASVTCLERGREGEVIRVRGEDGQVFRARISGPARLEAVPQ